MQRPNRVAAVLATLLFVPVVSTAAGPTPKAASSKCWTYAKPDGESFFALGLNLETEGIDDRPREVLVLFDTSASQIGAFRSKAMATLEKMLAALDPRDRVNLMAVDLDAVPMSNGFVGAHSAEMNQALEKLHKRTPLGATDMEQALLSTMAAFTSRSMETPRAAVYIGDGMSPANLIMPEMLDRLMAGLVSQRIPLSGFAIGARIDSELLGAIANHSGGLVAINYNEVNDTQYARFLANAVHATVIWPEELKLPKQIVEAYPTRRPPLRTDRDSVLVGRGQLTEPFEITARVKTADGWHDLSWTVTPPEPDDVYAFLAELTDVSRKQGGINLPTAGSAGLAEARLALNSELRKVLVLARQALAMKNLDQAESLAKKALEFDSSHPEAETILGAVKKLRAGEKFEAPAPGGDLKIQKPAGK